MGVSRLVLALGIIAILANVGCMKDIKEKQGDLGTESSPTSVQKALDEALGNISIGTAQIGQMVTYEDNLRIELGDVMPMRYARHELKAVTEDKAAATVTFNILEDWVKMDFSGKKIDEKHGEFSIGFKTSANSAAAPGDAGSSGTAAGADATGQAVHFVAPLDSPREQLLLKLKELGSQTPADCDGKDTTDKDGLTYDCVRYFNLVSEHQKVEPPELVKTKPNCGGLPDCLMNVRFLKYDEVKWSSSGQVVKKVTVTAQIAVDVADLMYEMIGGEWSHTPPVLSLCVKGPYDINGTVVKVTQCTVLRDFK